MSPAVTSSGAGRAEQMAVATAALCGALLVSTLPALALETRTLNDISVWAKPLKFHFAFALHWLTLALLLRCVDAAARESNAALWPLRAAALSTLIEVLYITFQAARGRASHFNADTELERLMYYGVMGPASIVIVAVTGWVGYLVWRHPEPGLGRGLVLGAVLGCLLSGLTTLMVTAPLSAGLIDGPGHWVGGIRSDAHGLPLVGWSTTGGDLRAPHFFATHLLQALPLAGWLADRLAPRRALGWVCATAGFGVFLVGWTLWQASSARQFIL